MRAILPGKPQAKLQAVTTGCWEHKQIIAYVSGNALVILDSPHHLLQTTYEEEGNTLNAVALDETSGKIATCYGATVLVYQPYGHEEGAVQWALQCQLPLDNDDNVETLSWGQDQELLVGSAVLSLFATHNGPERLWTRPLANPAKFASFSYDASMIASSGTYDRLVKIWWRLSYEGQSFDYSYLSHPALVTGLHWRRPFHREQIIDNVLYTICADSKVRIWSPSHDHGMHILTLWADIDMLESIQPRSTAVEARSKRRYAFIIDSRDFTVATERAVQQASNSEQEQMAIGHLVEVANCSPEVCVVLDDRGNMSAWGLESIGCKHRKTTDVFNIAHVDGLPFRAAINENAMEDNVQFLNFCSDQQSGGFTLLAHHFDGRLEWYEARVDQLFDLSPQQTQRLTQKALWTGHSQAIKKVVRTAKGGALISRSENNECIIWTQGSSGKELSLLRKSRASVSDHIHRMVVLRGGDFVVLLHHDRLSIWDSRFSQAKEVGSIAYEIDGKPLCLIIVPETEAGGSTVHLATVSSSMKGIAWEVQLPDRGSKKGHKKGHMSSVSVDQFDTFELGTGDDLAYVLPVDPAGTLPAISGFLDTFARDIAISYTKQGELKSWTAKVDSQAHRLKWLLTSTVETGIVEPSLASATSIRKAALVNTDRNLLTIWNTRNSLLEYEERFEGQGDIQDLDWSSTPDNQSILAAGFPHRVIIYTQLRYDYFNAGTAWAAIREIRIRDLTPHPIGDSVWLGNGQMVIGAGNQLFVQDSNVEFDRGRFSDVHFPARKAGDLDLFTLVSTLNGPLPIYHPQALTQCILAGKMPLVQRILTKLHKILKFYSDGDEVDSLLGLSSEEFWTDLEIPYNATRKEMHSSYADFSDEEDAEVVTEEVASSLNELLTRVSVPRLSSREQFNLVDVIECVGTVEKHRRSIDGNGSRFLLFFREHNLRASQHSSGPSPLSWRDIVWAYHSGSQDILADLVTRHYNGKMLWQHAKESGVFMWMSDINALRAQFEVVARNEYTKTDEKNPVDCSLYYLALKKKAVLVGLWRMATWSREHGATSRLLANNFQEARWRTAALKNAYALMGKRRFEYAAAFFLLAGELKDAVGILANKMQDMQLAIAVARVYEGDDGPVLREFLDERVLPQAVMDGNRWLATWALWMLGRRDKAIKALITPLSELLSPPQSPGLQSKLYLADDPALVVLYKQLREKSLQTLKGALSVSPRAEWEFVLRTAELYGRMGCDLLAVDLVRNWEFFNPPPGSPQMFSALPTSFPQHSQHPPAAHMPSALDGFDIDPHKVMRRRSSLVVADLPSRDAIKTSLGGTDGANEKAEAKKDEKKNGAVQEKRNPTQFQEPDANSLLDSFGF
ncbi:WD repeat protein-like protein [Aulographum hederae CBS 113979]|uniref:WD repeat protein-like protein n=1 Tax=Aulographum hederae CBS 113979 TaxID=1176131 RepID=A0A6G1GK54_9PEZI|nr:WD repeat protein-like protein [Aulographum hederae CBS 113979]